MTDKVCKRSNGTGEIDRKEMSRCARMRVRAEREYVQEQGGFPGPGLLMLFKRGCLCGSTGKCSSGRTYLGKGGMELS